MAKNQKRGRQSKPEWENHEQDDRDFTENDDLDDGKLRELSESLGDGYEIIGPDDELEDDLEWDTVDVPGRATVSLDTLVQRLIQDEDVPALRELYALSDLSREETELLRSRWELIPPARRRAVVERLVGMAEEELGLQLDRMLRIALSDSDAGVRRAAVKGLWEDGGADLIGPLVQMLHNDPSPEVRAAAATGLGGYVLAGELEELDTALSMRAEEALLAVLADTAVPLEVRRRALESVAYSGEAGVRQLIEDAYYAPEELMRVSALFAMGRSADIRWRGLVRAELQNPSAAMRAEAAYACGELEAKSALDSLLGLLGDRDQTVRLAAIFALGRIGGRDARDALEAVMLSEGTPEAEAAENALEEMSFFAGVEAVPLFDESLEEDEDWDVDPLDEWYDMDDRELGEYEDELDAGDWDDDEPLDEDE